MTSYDESTAETSTDTTAEMATADPADAAALDDAEADAVDDDPGDVRSQVEEVIELIRPALQMDGGDIALVDIDDGGTVTVQLHGSCVGCPASVMTLKAGVERILKDRIPDVTEVVAV